MHVERANSFITELHCLKEFVECIKENIGKIFFPLSVKAVLERNNIIYEQVKKVLLEVDNYYATCSDYLLKWFHPLKNFVLLHGVTKYSSNMGASETFIRYIEKEGNKS